MQPLDDPLERATERHGVNLGARSSWKVIGGGVAFDVEVGVPKRRVIAGTEVRLVGAVVWASPSFSR